MDNNIAGISDWARELKASLSEFVLNEHKGVHKQIMRDAQALTPVVTGQLKGSWISSVGSKSSFAPGRPSAPEGSVITDTVLSEMKPGDNTWIVNNARYANKIEVGDSRRPGRLMGAIAVSRVGVGEFLQPIGDG